MEQDAARTHAARALIELRKKILSGELAPGTRLFEVPLTEMLSISRTPVREALLRLSEEGLLERVRSGGFVVRTFSVSDVVDALELRGVMEGTAARLAAERGVSPSSLAALQEIVASLDQCFGPGLHDVDFDRYRELNAEFHAALTGLCGSPLIQREVERISRLPFASPSAFLQERADFLHHSLRTAHEQHRNIVAAIARREGSRAEALAREHASLTRSNLEHALKEDMGRVKQLPGLALVN